LWKLASALGGCATAKVGRAKRKQASALRNRGVRHEPARRTGTEDDATLVLRQERQARGHWNPGVGIALDLGRLRCRAERPEDWRPSGSAPLSAQGQAGDLSPPVGGAVADGALRLQAAARKAARDRITGVGAHGP